MMLRQFAPWLLFLSEIDAQHPSGYGRKRPFGGTGTGEVLRPYEPDVTCPAGYTLTRTTCEHRGHSATYRLACRPPYAYDPAVLRAFFAGDATGERTVPSRGVHYVRGYCPARHRCEPFDPRPAGESVGLRGKLGVNPPPDQSRTPRLVYKHIVCVFEPSMKVRSRAAKRRRPDDHEEHDRDPDDPAAPAPDAPCQRDQSKGADRPDTPRPDSLDDDDDWAFLEDIITYESAKLCALGSIDRPLPNGRAQTADP